MNNVIWKKFKIGDLFERSTKLAISTNQKDLNICEQKDDDHQIALISASRSGSGRVGYIENDLVDEKSISINKITFDDQWGFTFFLEVKEIKLKEVLDKNLDIYNFISLIINKVTIKSNIFGYGYKINNKLDREVILLPCVETDDSEYIWEENKHYYSIASDYITKLMAKAKDLREEKTIRLYEAERAKYEAERAKYEAEYLEEKQNVVWKKFSLDYLFNFDSGNQLSTNRKALEVSEVKDEEHTIALITQSEKDNGVSGYLESSEEIESKKMNNYLTYSMHFGLCFFHDYNFVLMDTHGSVFRLIPKQERLNVLMNKSKELNRFIAKCITKICCNKIYNYSWLPNSTRVGREIIMLPCLEVTNSDEYTWEDNDKKFSLAVNYISYIYLSGMINYNQTLIDNYKYQY